MMFRGLLRAGRPSVYFQSLHLTRRLGSSNVPFQDDLVPLEDEAFNLQDFQHYKESADVIAKKREIEMERLMKQSSQLSVDQDQQDHYEEAIQSGEASPAATESVSLEALVKMEKPLVFVSKLSDPYLNLAIEDYVYNNMPFTNAKKSSTYNRLMFYVNSPCVVVGKNQNPWKEVNLPLLHSLHIPLVRRKSGGGTVVHDSGNVNFSYMTSKHGFDRFKFAEVVVSAVNEQTSAQTLKVNERGDIVTQEDSLKVSGSAYKISRGKSYHHGTMLLNSRLDILGKLLYRDEAKLGVVDAMSSISSVRSKVTNIGLKNEDFMQAVSYEFAKAEQKEEESREEASGSVPSKVPEEAPESATDGEALDQNELFGLSDFANAPIATTITIDSDIKLPQEILDEAESLKQWNWRFGSTPKFSHTLRNDKFQFSLKFNVDKHAVVESFELYFDSDNETGVTIIPKETIISSFEFLEQVIQEGKAKPVEERLKYTGSSVSGFITNDMISDWVGQCIDGTI